MLLKLLVYFQIALAIGFMLFISLGKTSFSDIKKGRTQSFIIKKERMC
jgi:hypothetical protein